MLQVAWEIDLMEDERIDLITYKYLRRHLEVGRRMEEEKGDG